MKLRGFCVVLMGITLPFLAQAANGVWYGTSDNVWVNNSNWSVAPYPSVGDRATFNNGGNGNTTLDLAGLDSLLYMDFITGAGAYTIGSGGVNNQTLKLRNGGYVTLFASATNSQLFNAKIDLGAESTGATTTYFVNDTAKYNITLAGDITSSVAGNKRLQLQGFSGTGVVSGAFSDFDATVKNNLYKNGRGTWKVTGNNTFKGNVEINQGTLIIDNSNALGTGSKTVRLSNGTAGNPQLHLDGSEGEIILETNLTFITSCDTDGVLINIAGTNTVKGSFAFASGGGGTTITARKDKLILSGALYAGEAGRSLSLRGDGDGEISGVISNGATANLPLNRNLGSGTWTLTGSNTFSGATSVSFGKLVLRGPNGSLSSGVSLSLSGTFELVNSSTENNLNRLSDTATITLGGGTFGFIHDAGDADYAETAGLLVLTGARTTFVTSQAQEGKTSILTFSSLSRKAGTINFTGTGLGLSDRNRIFITNQVDGVIGPWATITTESGTYLAAYSSVNGIYASAQMLAEVTTSIDALGPDSLIPSSSNGVVKIATKAGSGGSINLEGLTVTTNSWIEQDTDQSATINMVSNAAPQTLATSAIIVNADKASLTVGESPNNGKLMALNAADALVLENNSTNGQLIVNASILNNGASTVLYKYGEGQAILNGTNNYAGTTTVLGGELIYASSQNQTFTGNFNNYGTLIFSNSAPLTTLPTIINQGTLLFAGTAIVTNKVTGSIGGLGPLIKNDPGVLHLMGQCSYSGPTYINAGIARPNDVTAFGPDNAGTYIADGATLAIGCSTDVGGTRGKEYLDLQAEHFYISGTGVDGKGVIVNDSVNSQNNALGMVSMQGDSTFSGISSFYVRNQTLRMNGYTLTKTGTNDFGLVNEHVFPGATGKINIQQGAIFRLDGSTIMNGSEDNLLSLNTGVTLDLNNLIYPVDWSLAASNGVTIRAASSTATTQNTWNGPVALDGLINMTSGNGAYSMTFSNRLSGDATIIKSGHVRSVLSLTSPLNTYSGNTIISNGVLYAKYPESLPGASTGKVSIPASTGNIGTIGVAVDNGTFGWSADAIRDMLAATSYTTMYASLWLDAAANYEYPYSVSNPIGLWKTGAGRLLLSAPQTFTGELRVNGGCLALNSALVYTTNITAYVGENAGDTGELALAGTAKVTSTLPAAAGAAPLISVGNNGKGVVTLKDQAILTGKLYMGNGSGAGAVYQVGNSTVTNWCGTSADGRWGVSGYGYYELTGGSLVNMGFHQLGVNAAGVGVFVQKDGSFEQLTTFGGRFALSRGGTGIAYTEGGTFTSVPQLYVGGDSTSSSGGVGAFTVDGTSQVTIQSYLEMCFAAAGNITFNRTGYFNLNGGLFSANYISKGTVSTNTVAYVGFNGGTYKARQHGTMIASGNAGPDMVTVYGGGLTVDTAGYNTAIPVPLRAPVGQGISDITLNSAGADYIGPPAVTLSGGGGVGASAVALFDSSTRTLTGVRVTSPGVGYTSAPTLSLVGGGGTGAVATASIDVNSPSGGLVKTGAGTLSLAGGSTYTGETDVNQGTLILSSPGALTTGAIINVANGATLKMSAGSRNLAHRWSFNSDYTDSVGGATATPSSNAVGKILLSSTNVWLAGGAKGTSAIVLPGNLLPHANAPVTIELWATTHMTNSWSRVFDFGGPTDNYLVMAWTYDLNYNSDRVTVKWTASNQTSADNTMAPYILNRPYHIALMVTPYGGTNNLTLVHWVRHDLTTGEKKKGSFTTAWTLAQLNETTMYLGRSNQANSDAAAIYDEVRFWNTALTEAQLDENVLLGPDTLPGDVSDDYQVNLSAGSTVDLMGGTSEVDTLSGSGQISNGSLSIKGKFLADVTKVGSNSLLLTGDLTFAEGATIEVVNPELLVPGRGYTIARAASVTGTLNWTNPPNSNWTVKFSDGQLKLYTVNTVILFR